MAKRRVFNPATGTWVYIDDGRDDYQPEKERPQIDSPPSGLSRFFTRIFIVVGAVGATLIIAMASRVNETQVEKGGRNLWRELLPEALGGYPKRTQQAIEEDRKFENKRAEESRLLDDEQLSPKKPKGNPAATPDKNAAPAMSKEEAENYALDHEKAPKLKKAAATADKDALPAMSKEEAEIYVLDHEQLPAQKRRAEPVATPIKPASPVPMKKKGEPRLESLPAGRRVSLNGEGKRFLDSVVVVAQPKARNGSYVQEEAEKNASTREAGIL